MAKKIIKNPHDLFLKATLNSPQAIYDFFQAHLPQHLCKDIDINTIVPAQASHVSSTLKELHHDFVFTCKIGQDVGFLLVEHQSSPDWHMPLRFAKYNTSLLESYVKDKEIGIPLPFIYNICLYHYKMNQPYPYPTNLDDYFPNPHLAQELGISTRFHLINLSSMSDHDIESHRTISLAEKLFKYSRDKRLFEILGEELDRCMSWILGNGCDAPALGADYWKSILYYTSNVLDTTHHSEEDLVNLFKEKLFIPKQEIMRTIAHQIEKRGIEIGIQKGLKEKAVDIAKNMLQKGYDIKSIQEITGLAKEAINQLTKR